MGALVIGSLSLVCTLIISLLSLVGSLVVGVGGLVGSLHMKCSKIIQSADTDATAPTEAEAGLDRP